MVVMKHGLCLYVYAILAFVLAPELCRHRTRVAAFPRARVQDQGQLINGTAAVASDYLIQDEEFLTESDITRRILSESMMYTSYEVTKYPDKPVCSGPNPTYRSCLPPGHKDQQRGCQKVYKCRSESSASP